MTTPPLPDLDFDAQPADSPQQRSVSPYSLEGSLRHTRSSTFRSCSPHFPTKNYHQAKNEPVALRDFMNSIRAGKLHAELKGGSGRSSNVGSVTRYSVPGKALALAGVGVTPAASATTVTEDQRTALIVTGRVSTGPSVALNLNLNAGSLHDDIVAAVQRLRDNAHERKEFSKYCRAASASARATRSDPAGAGVHTPRPPARRGSALLEAVVQRARQRLADNSRPVSARSQSRSRVFSEAYEDRQQRAAESKESLEAEFVRRKEEVALRSATQLARQQAQAEAVTRAVRWAVVAAVSSRSSAWLKAVRRERVQCEIRHSSNWSFGRFLPDGDARGIAVETTDATSHGTLVRSTRARLVAVFTSVRLITRLYCRARRRTEAARTLTAFLRQWKASVPTEFYLKRFAYRAHRLQAVLADAAYRNRTRHMWALMQLTVADRPCLGAGTSIGLEHLKQIATQCSAKPAADFALRLVTTVATRVPILFRYKLRAIKSYLRRQHEALLPELEAYTAQRKEQARLEKLLPVEKAREVLVNRDGRMWQRPRLARWLPTDDALLPSMVAGCRKRMEADFNAAFRRMWDAAGGNAMGMSRLAFALQFEGHVLSQLEQSRAEEFIFVQAVAHSASGALADRKGAMVRQARRARLLAVQSMHQSPTSARGKAMSGSPSSFTFGDESNDDTSSHSSKADGRHAVMAAAAGSSQAACDSSAEEAARARLLDELRRSWFVRPWLETATRPSPRSNGTKPRRALHRTHSATAKRVLTLREVCRRYCVQRSPAIAAALGVASAPPSVQ
jgi:hypothetical protein